MSDEFFQLTNDISLLSMGLLVACVICLTISLRVLSKYTKLSKTVSQLQNEIRAMNSGHLGMGREIRKVSKEVANVENIHQQTFSHGTSDKIYEQAGLLLSRGATIEEVVESCEITPAEAELIAIMRHSAPGYSHNKSSLVA